MRSSLRTLQLTLLLCPALSGCLERTLAPLSPCLVSNVIDEKQVTRIDRVDLLFMVDNSSSMKEEQAALQDQFPKLIRALTTGDRDGDGREDFEPVADLHLGVVSSDLGLPNAHADGCREFGDDGILNDQASLAIRGCKPSYPRYLSYVGGKSDPNETAHDFACLAQLGTSGCGYEQQLEAPLKALWPSIDPMPIKGQNRVRFLGNVAGDGQLGHGDRENAGFLRDEKQGASILAIVLVTDEDDCSSSTTEDLATLDPLERNIRCSKNKQALYDITRYKLAYQALRPGHPELVLFAAIAGVPPELVDERARKDVKFEDAAQRDAYYQRVLGDPRMQEQPLATGPDGSLELRKSCDSKQGAATPPRRITEVVRDFGNAGILQSVCQDDFAPAMQAIIELISDRLPSLCVPHKQVRDSEGLVGCEVVWELPPPASARPGTPTACGQADFPFLIPTDSSELISSKGGGALCKVPQLRVVDDANVVDKKRPVDTVSDGRMFRDGWFYDDYTAERGNKCKGEDRQRLAFTPGAAPPNGVIVRLQCLDERQSLPMQHTDANPALEQPSLGDACDEVVRGGRSLKGDAACEVQLTASTSEHPDGVDHGMFCHPKANLCVRACAGDSDCPAAWTCDQRSETLQGTTSSMHPNGRAICVNPTCGERQ